ncbi:MAG TPA: SRPBCC family protein [Caulobacteraceae bacterium]
MSVVDTTMEADDRTLVLTRLIAAPPVNLYRAWTEPALMKQWFAPLPWTTPHAEVDVRPGGSSLVVMRDPDGTEFPNRGVYLEVQPNRRLVFTDAYVRAWEPSAKPFMTVVLSFAEEAGGTLYTARVHHWTAEDRKTHEAMGFHQGWGQCADQLASLMARL